MLRRIDPVDGSLSRRILATSSRSYYNAFAKIMSGNEFALNEQERQAISEMRASLTDNAGGYAIPFSVDTTMISTDDGSVNPFRQISTVKQITADVWQGVSSAGVTASFDSEAAEVSDDSPTLAGPTITTYMARAFVPFSIEIGQDWANIDADLRSMFQDAKDDLETTAFSTGSGPIGIITALTGGSSEINAAGEAVALADLYSLDNALPARYRQNASWVANKSTYNAVRALDTYGGGGMWERIGAAMPARLLGYPVYESSAFDGSIDAGATANNYVAVLGDFKYFYIVDRVGMNVELIPHLFHTSNNLPSGRRGMFAHWRVGSDSVNDAAFRMLDVATTA
jgi:HK97 family phage major capsid protein